MIDAVSKTAVICVRHFVHISFNTVALVKEILCSFNGVLMKQIFHFTALPLSIEQLTLRSIHGLFYRSNCYNDNNGNFVTIDTLLQKFTIMTLILFT